MHTRTQSGFTATVTMLLAASGLAQAADNKTLYAPPICPHILGWPADVKEWANGAPWIKALDITSCGIAKERGARVLYRPWDHASGPDGDPKIGGLKFGKEILDRLKFLPLDRWPDAISFQNEFNNVSPQAAGCFMEMYDVLRRGGYKGLIVFGSYGPGGPTDKTEWARPHIKAACLKADAIETHEYWDLTVKNANTWLAHRHVRAMRDYPWLRSKPWFIGEFGSDGVNQNEDPQKRTGWRDRNKLTPEAYIKQIEIYRWGDKADDIPPPAENVLAVFLYQQGSKQWQHYETRGTPLMGYMKSTWKPTHGFFTGKVTDAAGKPVEGVEVTASPSGKKAVTDAKGVYWLFALPPGNYSLQASKAGMPSAAKKPELKAGEIANVDLALK